MAEEQQSTASWVFSFYVGKIAAWVILVSLLVAAALWSAGSVGQAEGILFASALSVVNMLILGGRLSALPVSPSAAARSLGVAVLQRWAFTIVGLILAIFWLRLPIMGIVGGFLLAHAIYLGFMLWERSKKRS
ncbi:MAG: hypothetical protein K0041_06180 [Acidithiobacillus sp.]|nr:hypothetical protein [Acidithiobacillus sp.]